MKTILVIEDDEAIRTNILDLLDAEGFDGLGAEDGSEGLELARRHAPDVILCDIMMPSLDGHAVLERLRADPDLAPTPFIFITARADRDDQRKGMIQGADDYITKPFERAELLEAIYARLQRQKVVQDHAPKSEPISSGRATAPKRSKRHTAIVRSPAMQKLYAEAEAVARSPLSVLLLGQTGTGKDVLAYEIHRRSRRAEGPFVPINCGAIQKTLVESTLFGHVTGAFTGAKDRPGLFEEAHGGTVFLDEVGELDLDTQVKLLRVLEDKVVKRLGSSQEREVDVRFVAATNRDLAEAVRQGTFREDLYYRLNGIALGIPPLSERKAEIGPLAEHFCQRACEELGRSSISVSPEALEVLEAHDFPGNVRELKNIIDRAVYLCRGDTLLPEHLRLEPSRRVASMPQPVPPEAVTQPSPGVFDPPSSDPTPDSGPVSSVEAYQAAKDELEKKRILAALEETAGNQTRAAKLLGMSRRTLVSRLDKYDIDRPRKKR